MQLTLHRTKSGPTSTLGFLEIDGVEECYTLERPAADAGGLAPFCIIPDTYKFTIAYFPHQKIYAPLLEDKHGRTGIFVHPGNFPKDTAGCILVGRSQGKDFVGNSREALDRLMAKLEKGITYSLLVK